jgi:hypothetical protein
VWSQQRKPLPGNSSANTPTAARQWLVSRQVIAATHAHNNRKNSWKRCFLCSLWEGYIVRTTCQYESLEMAVRMVGGWCEMTASLWGCDPRSIGTSAVGKRYQAAQRRPWLRTLVCVRTRVC